MKYCPVCGVHYEESMSNKDYCQGKRHPHSPRVLHTWEHEHVELVSSSFEDGGYYSGDTGEVDDVRGDGRDIDLWISWDSGADECWIPAEDCVGY